MELHDEYVFDVIDRISFALKNKPDELSAILECYSRKQYQSKKHLVDQLLSLNILQSQYVKNVVVLACWYGYTLFPMLNKYVDDVLGVDIDPKCKTMLNNKPIDKCDIIENDIFNQGINPGQRLSSTTISKINQADLIINTSCEHMKPVNQWGRWDDILPDIYVAFQSNDMFYVDDHINCVNNIDEFISQMPSNLKILSATEIEICDSKKQDSNYKRFTIIGQT